MSHGFELNPPKEAALPQTPGLAPVAALLAKLNQGLLVLSMVAMVTTGKLTFGLRSTPIRLYETSPNTTTAVMTISMNRGRRMAMLVRPIALLRGGSLSRAPHPPDDSVLVLLTPRCPAT